MSPAELLARAIKRLAAAIEQEDYPSATLEAVEADLIELAKALEAGTAPQVRP